MAARVRLIRLRRLLHGGRVCAARRCPRRRVDGLSHWCRDHTDAITVGEVLRVGQARSTFHERDEAVLAAARRLGARRWLLLAEVAQERERVHVEVLAEIVEQSESARAFNRPCWAGLNDPGLSTPLEARANELLGLR